MKKNLCVIYITFGLLFFNISAQNSISKTWVADLGNGTYKNPVLYADYSDPDVCRVGEDYYMTASSFNCIPGLPVLHSYDLVNWKIINYAIEKLTPEDVFSIPQHGNGVWAPSIRFHNNEFYIYYGDPDYGIFMVKTKNPEGKWSEPKIVKAGKGLIDPCPLWDEDGRVYLVHAFAGSRAGIKSLLAISELDSLGENVISNDRIIYDGHLIDPTIEGPKFYKRNEFYYIFAPAGGVSTGWQVVLKSKNIFGPYERKIVMAQGNTKINGPHQGAWINTVSGEDWFIHFQDKEAFGRVVHLQPMIWKNDFPVIGVDKDGDGCGEPVSEYRKPNVGKIYLIETPQESDEFNSNALSLQWQWHANPESWWSFPDITKGVLNLYSVPIPNNYKNLWNAPNLLLQKFPSDKFKVIVKWTFYPSENLIGERAGLIIMGVDYGVVTLEKTEKGLILYQAECLNADKGNKETVNKSVLINTSTLYLQAKVNSDSKCVFSFSTDGNRFKEIGKVFEAKPGKWIGAKVGLFCSRPQKTNDGGKVEVDWFRVDKY
ncbi:conserved exported hypothetical protein [uncultured Paludibacter sp.]|uniref:Beta-xylosidase C-terminal Concanavalin A-like domain-containing protein n=1 Tax=uncultured Paludibacter sp. TaxID=497635 RepID=A0A653AKL2_9BACT|nr:conserved exported hypothetical protein [uncultured Paludibacter sp.]